MAAQYQARCESHSIPTYNGGMFPDTTCWFKTFMTAVALAAAGQRSPMIHMADTGKQTKVKE